MNLNRFVDAWNNDQLRLPTSETLSPTQDYRIRPSELGKPAYVQAIKRLMYWYGNVHDHTNDGIPYGRREDRLQVGHETEERIINIMRASGLAIEYQVPVEIEIEGYSIKGTADLVIDDMVVDIKTAMSSAWTRMKSYIPDAYYTQVQVYATALNLSKAALLTYNKDTHELAMLDVPVGDLARERQVLRALAAMDNCSTLAESVDYVMATMDIPQGKPQIRAGKETGIVLVHPDLYFEPVVRDILFECAVDSAGLRTIVRPHTPEEVATRIKESYS